MTNSQPIPGDPDAKIAAWMANVEERLRVLETAPRMPNTSSQAGSAEFINPDGLRRIVIGDDDFYPDATAQRIIFAASTAGPAGNPVLFMVGDGIPEDLTNPEFQSYWYVGTQGDPLDTGNALESYTLAVADPADKYLLGETFPGRALPLQDIRNGTLQDHPATNAAFAPLWSAYFTSLNADKLYCPSIEVFADAATTMQYRARVNVGGTDYYTATQSITNSTSARILNWGWMKDNGLYPPARDGWVYLEARRSAGAGNCGIRPSTPFWVASSATGVSVAGGWV